MEGDRDYRSPGYHHRGEGLRDWGSFGVTPSYSDEDYRGRRSENATTYSMRLHLPDTNRKPRRRRHQRKPRPEVFPTDSKSPHAPPSTPPSQRVQLILGGEEEEDDTHDVFCEMTQLTELRKDPADWEWRETARWIKFEEDVEEGGARWSKPRVATLYVYSLFELRKALLGGTLLLDRNATTKEQVADLILDNMISSHQLRESLRSKVREILLSPHRHLFEKKSRRGEQGQKPSIPIIRALPEIGKKSSKPKVASEEIGTATDPQELESKFKLNVNFMKKIPADSETANILIGEVDFLNAPIVAFMRLSKATLLGDLTEVPVPTRFIFLLLGPKGNTQKYYEIGRSMGTLMSDDIFHDVAYKAKNRQDLLAGVDEFLSNCTVLPPAEWDPSIRIEPPKSLPSQEQRKKDISPVANGTAQTTEDTDDHVDPTLVRTGRFFGGLIDDIKRKSRFYLSDFRDALHIQCLASYVFLYFACLTPIVTFGGLIGDATGQKMAAMENILAGAICGITFALCSGQPLCILGSTGPMLVFEKITANFCQDHNMDYLPFRWWVGIWSCVFLVIIVAFDLSALVRYITRFTEESFATLISVIFIKEAFAKCLKIMYTHPLNLDPDAPLDYNCSCVPGNNTKLTATSVFVTSQSSVEIGANMTKKMCKGIGGELSGSGCDTPVYYDNVFFLSVILFFGTFVIAMALKALRNSRFFPSMVRSIISDFAVILAIIIMVGMDAAIGLPTPKLSVPSNFRPTHPDRSWLIHPFGHNPWWTCLAAILPAIPAVILIFMDQQITGVIVNRKEHKLKKGGGYHLDLFIVAILIAVCSILGLPWFVAATVESLTHVMSLKKESECSAPGERPQFLGIREQRVTGSLIFLTIGLSVLLAFILKFIPMPVLYGVFLYMGVSALRSTQLIRRILIIFMPTKYQPDYMYLRYVRIIRVHIFTFIQVLCLAVLWTIKAIKTISIAFPVMVLAMCFVRKGLDWIFTQEELRWLDDIMPETSLRAKDDEKRLNDDDDSDDDGDDDGEGQTKTLEFMGGEVEIPLSDGHVMSVPVEKITYKSDPHGMNISDEMAKTGMWRHLVADENPGHKKARRRHPHHHRHGKKKKISILPDDRKLSNVAEASDEGVLLNMSAKKEKGQGEEMESLMPSHKIKPGAGTANSKDSPV